MRFPCALLALSLLVVASPGQLLADDVSPASNNVLWIVPPVGSGDPATPGQFGGFSTVTSSASTAQGAQTPASGTLRLQVSYFGASVAGSPPEFALGDVIGTPLVSFPNAQSIFIGLRREPVRKADGPFKYRTASDPTIREFTPATAILSERFFWSQHARFSTQPDFSNTYEALAAEGQPGSILRDGFVYAGQGGSSRVYWRTTAAIGVDGSNNPVFGLVERVANVSTASRLPVRRFFWTEHGFQGQPVAVTRGEIQQVRIAHNDTLPELVPDGSQYPSGGDVPPTRRTIWHDGTLNSLHAYNREGRILIEFLAELRAGATGLRRQVGVEVVDVIQEALPGLVQVPVGDRLYPLPPDQGDEPVYPLPPAGSARDGALARIDSLLASFGPLPIANAAADPPFTLNFTANEQTTYYATRATGSATDVQFFWTEPGLANLRWPKFLNRYTQYWPSGLEDYAVNVRPTDSTQASGTPPFFGTGTSFQLVYQDNGQAQGSNTAAFVVDLNTGTPTNRSLLLVTSGDSFWFLRVESVLDTFMAGNPRYTDFYQDTQLDPNNQPTALTALVGQRILPPTGADSIAGFVDLTKGDAIDPTAYRNPFTVGIPDAETTGAIIPINAAPKRGTKDNDRLTVWWFKKVNPPAALAGRIAPIYWPSFHIRYQLTWPANAPQIVLASNAGSGDLPADAAGGTIYVENNPASLGYNPNEEHAQMIAGRAYALRDDLNVPQFSSSAYVLVRYRNAVDLRPDMRAFRVLRENETHTFTYNARAGTILNPPLPLAVMPPPLVNGESRNLEVTPPNLDPPANIPGGGLGALERYRRFTYEDRKGIKWIYRGQHNPDGTPPSLGMKFYYATQDGFAYPNAATGVNEAPALGTITPFLWDGATGDRQTGTAITIGYRPFWPDQRAIPGLVAEYFANLTVTGVPQLRRVESTVNINHNGTTAPGAGLTATSFSARYTGVIVIPTNGSYRFHVTSDDGVRLWIGNVDGAPAVNQFIVRGATEDATGSFTFAAGQRVPVKVEYFNGTASGVLALRWEGPGIVKSIVPSTALLSSNDINAEVPELQFAETLVQPKFGLPGVGDASSAVILYQQSIGKNVTAGQEAAVLHDPTRRKVYLLGPSLPTLPTSILTDTSGGKTYFQGLPAHLQQRLFVDGSLGTAGGLVLMGEFHEEPVGEDYIDLNVLTPVEVNVVKALVAATDPRRAAWLTAVDSLTTTLETFVEDPQAPGTYVVNAAANKIFNQGQLVKVTHVDQAVDSYALTAMGGGAGYVTVILGEGRAFTDVSEPVQMHILKIGPSLYRGQVKPIAAANPLAEDLTLQHTGDFAGQADAFEFEWFYSPPVNGQPPTNRPGQPGATWFPQTTNDGPRLALGATQPILTLTDNYYVMRHRPLEGHALRPVGTTWTADQGWSEWTDPALAEGWIKRVLAGINPFNQRVSDFYNNTVNTDVSLLTSAGERWEGNVPLTLDAVQNAGLISIYETVLRRGMSFTIEGNPAINYGPANDALLLAAGYLNDLYMALGNEAYADAANPLISLDVDASRLLLNQGLAASIGTTIQTTASARFAFEGQVPSLLDEELTLLRGRDDFLVPGTRTAPLYNRFIWNFTRGIDAGEVIYALNYNISEKAGPNADGKIDAADARRQYPQGHGDAYGHYLTAVTNYYRLLANSAFTWTPRVEAVNILGVPVTVDYQDERKFAAAAVALGRTASRILDLERRKLPTGAESGWSAFREARANSTTGNTRTWGLEQWAARAGQGNFLHWAAVNALLPAVDNINQGIQKIDRTTVVELDELASLGAEIQSSVDGANRRVNALDLSDDSLLFDLSPSQLAAGQSHFDQILARAKAALANAATAHERTITQNALLRSVENQAADYSFTVDREEFALVNRLYDIYGIPYPGDIGPGKTYPQGYDGPDFFRYMFINRPYVYSQATLFGVNQANNFTRTFSLPIRSAKFFDLISGFDGETGSAAEIAENYRDNYVVQNGQLLLSYTVNLNDGPYQIAPAAMGQRPFVGSIQTALLEMMQAREKLLRQASGLERSKEAFDRQLQRFAEDIDAANRVTANSQAVAASKLALNKAVGAYQLFETITGSLAKTAEDTAKSLAEALPKVVGLATDATSVARGSILAAFVLTERGIDVKRIASQSVIYGLQTAQDIAELKVSILNNELDFGVSSVRAKIVDLQSSYTLIFEAVRDIDLTAQELEAALAKYRNEIINGETILAERETFRKRAAAVIQGARTRDVAFRAFRTESLEQYKILYDQAARYAFLAARAYDYETGQLGTASGRNFLAGIVASRALGLVGANGEPQFGGGSSGDPGLSSYLAKLQADWGVAKGRLGINNPDQYGTLVSLRRELFNLPYKEDGTVEDDTAWQDKLRSYLVADLRTDPAIAAHALPTSNPNGLAQPGFVINFSGTIETGQNFFGNPLAAGDSAFSTASYSTKINSVGVAFKGYLGMNSYATGNSGIPGAPTHNSPDALAATPYVYLIPAGMDSLRTPPLNGAAITIRNWNVHDHAMPLPYDIGSGGFGQNTIWNSSTALSEPFFTPRKHQPFRAVSDPSLFFSTIPAEFTNRRLIGRSVWNTEWKLVIPAQTLLANPQDGIERFIRSVKDIKLFLRTYSNAGN